jgi:hypothetical protein
VAEANLNQQRAHFVSSDYIAWPFDTPADATYELHHAAEGGLEVVDGAIVGGESVELGYDPDGLPTRSPRPTGSSTSPTATR